MADEDDRMASDANHRASIIVALTAAAATAWLGSRRIGRSYHYDEAVSIVEFIASSSPIHAFTNQVVVNNHPLFSAVQAIVWRLGGTTEATQRISPILFGVIAVGVLGWAVTRRLGPLAGTASVIVMGLMPMFVAQTRQARGYSLAVAAITIAVLALAAWIRTGHQRWLILHGLAAITAVITHPYSAITFLVIAAAVTAAGLITWRLLFTWITAAVLALLLLMPILDDTLAATTERGRRFRPQFPLDALRALLGPGLLVILITGLVLITGVITLFRHSPATRAATMAGSLVAVGSILVIWAILQPFDLYPRFVLGLAPLIAMIAAIGARTLGPRAGSAALIALALASIPSVWEQATFEPGIRDAAKVVAAARDADLEACGCNVLPLRVYTEPPRLVRVPDDLDGCDVVVLLGNMSEEFREAALRRFAHRWAIAGGITVFAEVPRNELISPG